MMHGTYALIDHREKKEPDEKSSGSCISFGLRRPESSLFNTRDLKNGSQTADRVF